MDMSSRNAKVDALISDIKQWQSEIRKLRKVALNAGLAEDVKWGKPCFSYQGKNIVLIQGFKEYCAYLFFKGYLMDDPAKILVKTGEYTRIGRQIRFTSVSEIDSVETILGEYIARAIDMETSGFTPPPVSAPEIEFPVEFRAQLDASPELQRAFDSLSPGRKRGYLIYFASAKHSKTRTDRVQRCVSRIMDGIGLNERA